jgi:hypothetical protein
MAQRRGRALYKKRLVSAAFSRCEWGLGGGGEGLALPAGSMKYIPAFCWLAFICMSRLLAVLKIIPRCGGGWVGLGGLGGGGHLHFVQHER